MGASATCLSVAAAEVVRAIGIGIWHPEERQNLPNLPVRRSSTHGAPWACAFTEVLEELFPYDMDGTQRIQPALAVAAATHDAAPVKTVLASWQAHAQRPTVLPDDWLICVQIRALLLQDLQRECLRRKATAPCYE